MGLNWKFKRGRWIQTKKTSVGGVWIFFWKNTFHTDEYDADFVL